MSDKVYQIKISLKHSKPKIWRRILIQPDLTLADFHKVIQTTMGWTNSHLHEFYADGISFAPKLEDDWWDDPESVDYTKVKISDLLTKEGDRILYVYDFGDDWEHDILLEKILPADSSAQYPVCTAGKNNCPPEDVGGVSGYARMLEVLKNPDDENYEHYDMLYGGFDPEYFDIDEINELLKMDNFGSCDFEDFF